MRTTHLLAGVLAALAVTAAPAQADSILFLKGGDVWLSTGDGARQLQVTTTGGYAAASQGDDGTIVARRGQQLVKLSRTGQVLAEFGTPVSDGEARPYGSSYFEGPFDLDVSADGTKVAYSFYWQYWNMDGQTAYHTLRRGTAISATDRLTAWSEPGMGHQTGWIDASWYDGSNLLLGGASNPMMLDVATDAAGSANNDAKPWFYDPALADLRDPVVTKDHKKLAAIGGPANDQRLRVYRMRGEAPEAVQSCYELHGPTGGRFSSPTWSPDGTKLAWGEGDGIWIGQSPELLDCPTWPSEGPALRIPGGSQPDWGPADVPTSRPTTPTPVTPTPTTPAGSPATPVAGAPATGAVKPSVAAALTFPAACRRACTVKAVLKVSRKQAKALGLRGTTLATGAAKGSGTVRVTVTPTAAGRRALARLRGKATLALTIREGAATRRVTRLVAAR